MMTTTFVFGTFLVCKTTTKDVVINDAVLRKVCPTNEKHDTSSTDEFCRKCGAKLVEREMPEVEKDNFSALMIIHGLTYVDVALSKKDEAWLDKNADKFVRGYETPFGEDCDVFLFDCEEMDSQDEQQFMKTDFKFKQPPQELIDRLKRIVEYKDIKVKTGVFVRVW